ncbi:MAG: hypothetical protein WC377_04925 [Bacteroidales bacterium]|jgi:hypothetical protein|nr:hypothetical protein [Bacteroidales bacterium]MDD2824071.1 hypothetical protein [Bacteroidales bacterium]MDD3100545.1 hypothetical protein [Bacteroidales bacterium]MDD3639440.1 hypothetical protein [Bacteroidales bacterium]MDD3944118.1 hypothetical protein [Bacteroidales bacterium]
MKKTITVLLCLSALGSCHRTEDAHKVAQTFLESFFAAEYQKARTYAAPELYPVLDSSQAILDSLPEGESELVKNYLNAVEITVEAPGEIKGDTVRMPFRVEFSGFTEPGSSVICLRRERRIWKVCALE